MTTNLRSATFGVAAAAAVLMAAATARPATQPSRLLPADAGRVSALAFGPKHTVYVGTSPSSSKGRVYESTDDGEHWRLISARPWTWFDALAADPKQPGTLYAGTATAVYETADGGRTWRASGNGLLPPPGVNRGEGWVNWLGVDPANRNVLYEHDYADTLRTSLDQGRTWRVAAWRTPLGYMEGSALAWTRTPTVYAWFGGYTARSQVQLELGLSADGGRTWRRTPLHVTLRTWGSSTISVDPRHPRTVYAAAHSQVFVSSDAGAHWQSIGGGLPQNADVTSLAIGKGTIYAVLGTLGIWERPVGSGAWTQSWPQSEPTPGPDVSLLTVDPDDPSIVLAAYDPEKGSAGTHVLRSIDGGRTWTAVG